MLRRPWRGSRPRGAPAPYDERRRCPATRSRSRCVQRDRDATRAPLSRAERPRGRRGVRSRGAHHRGGAAERRTRKLLYSVASGGQEPHKLADAIELAANYLAERVAELLHRRFHLHDNHLVGQRTKVARHHERVVEGDDASHRFRYGALDLLVRWQHAIPAVGSDGAGRAATALDGADDHGTLEPLLGRLVLQTLDDRDRVVA